MEQRLCQLARRPAKARLRFICTQSTRITSHTSRTQTKRVVAPGCAVSVQAGASG